MCGRFALHTRLEGLIEEFDVDELEIEELDPRYNIPPSTRIPVVINRGGGNRLVWMRWGFVPSWDDDEDPMTITNARAETVAWKNAFKQAFRQRRCIIPADGFYEWKDTGDGKVPHYVTGSSGRPLGLAGIYEPWETPEGDEELTCTIITTDPNELVGSVHDRMPVMIRPSDRDRWLDMDVEDVQELVDLMGPVEGGTMDVWVVSAEVNSPRNDHPGLLEEAVEEEA